MVKKELLNDFKVEIANSDVEGILWIKFTSKVDKEDSFMYVPFTYPLGSRQEQLMLMNFMTRYLVRFTLFLADGCFIYVGT